MLHEPTGTVLFYTLSEGEELESAIKSAIKLHLQRNPSVRQIWCSKKEYDKEFFVDDYLVQPKGGCRTNQVMVF